MAHYSAALDQGTTSTRSNHGRNDRARRYVQARPDDRPRIKSAILDQRAALNALLGQTWPLDDKTGLERLGN